LVVTYGTPSMIAVAINRKADQTKPNISDSSARSSISGPLVFRFFCHLAIVCQFMVLHNNVYCSTVYSQIQSSLSEFMTEAWRCTRNFHAFKSIEEVSARKVKRIALPSVISIAR